GGAEEADRAAGRLRRRVRAAAVRGGRSAAPADARRHGEVRASLASAAKRRAQRGAGERSSEDETRVVLSLRSPALRRAQPCFFFLGSTSVALPCATCAAMPTVSGRRRVGWVARAAA